MANEQIEKKLRGTATFYTTGSVEFTPQQEGSPRFEPLKKTRNGALMRTTGEKQQSMVAHLKVPADSTDPAAELQDELEKLLKTLPEYHGEPRPRGRTLCRKEGAVFAYNGKKGCIEIALTIDLRQHVDYMKEFYKLTNELSQCLHINDDFLREQCRALAKCSTPSAAAKK